MNPRLAPAAYVSDGCFEVLRVTDPKYIQQILKLCKDNEIGMIIPTIDTELLVLAENKKHFEDNGIFVSVSSLDFIRICRDKRNTGEFFEKHGFGQHPCDYVGRQVGVLGLYIISSEYRFIIHTTVSQHRPGDYNPAIYSLTSCLFINRGYRTSPEW